MTRKISLLLVVCLLAVPTFGASKKLDRLFAEYWANYLADNPGTAAYLGDHRYDNRLYDISEEAYKRRYATARAFLKRADAIADVSLSDEERLSLKMLRRELQLAVEGESLHAYFGDNYLMPINQIEGPHVSLLSSPDTRLFDSARDYRNFVEMLRGFPAQVDAAIANMRKGMRLGVVLPKPVVERILPQLEMGIAADAKTSPLFKPVSRMPSSISAAERQSITAALEHEISASVSPAYRKLRDFMKDEYLPRARPNFSLSELPNGRAIYDYAIKVHTRTGLSADEIHEISLRELDRVTAQRQEHLKRVGFTGTIAEYNQKMQSDRSLRWYTAAEVERDLRENLAIIKPLLPRLFHDFPEVRYEIKPVEKFREASFPNGQYFAPSIDGKRPGIFYYNTFNVETEGVRKFMLPSLAFHEVVPGHHFGAVLTRVNTKLPRFRRYGGNSAFDEGWARYTEELADEVGAYRDPFARNFWLNAKTFALVGAVIETGIHTKGWTRDQAFAFMRKHLPMPEARFDVNMARWTSLPGQGLAYSLGDMKIRELRELSQRELGERFDIRDFHQVVLSNGTVPLDILNDNVLEWIKTKRQQRSE
ncbi:MAG TPA: DUF885 domain-containing protein [Pyrinomonadaceae bacterium]|nr:DUF885 domain-containing protein [Pyrinomonadaceae bacterium]